MERRIAHDSSCLYLSFFLELCNILLNVFACFAKLIYDRAWQGANGGTSLRSKLKVRKLGVVAFSIFYVIAGGAQVFILALSNFVLLHVGFLAVLSLVTAYGLVRMKRWCVLLTAILYILGLIFGITTLYSSIMQQTFYPNLGMALFHLAMVVYLIMTTIVFIYVRSNRESFQ